MTLEEIKKSAAAHGLSIEEYEDLRNQVPDISFVLALANGDVSLSNPLDSCPTCGIYNCPQDPRNFSGYRR